MKENYYFISDLHFGLLSHAEEVERELKFVKFLNSIQESAKELYILGDLFDYWFEYKKVMQKGYYRTFTALNDLVRSGTKVHYLIGNHDFMHRDFFEKEMTIICDPWIDKNALRDTARLKKPVLSLCDTNNYTTNVTNIIPCNNKSKKSNPIK